MYKEASRLKLRFETAKGLLSTEQLWDLNLTELKKLVEKQYEKTKGNEHTGLDFLDNEPENPTESLKFEVLKDIYLTKKRELAESKEEAAKKERNKRIAEIIAKKQDEELEGKSIEELQKMMES